MSQYGTARKLLDAGVAALAGAGRPVTTSYVQVGYGALDREMLCIRIMRGYRGVPAAPRIAANNCNDPGALDVTLCLLRDCWPTTQNNGSPPHPEDIDAASQLLTLDADLLMETMLRFPVMPDGGAPYPAVGLLEWLLPAGGLAGFTLNVAVPESFT